ncbi:MAG: hypothetical protein ACOH2J_13210 [Allorhizobium sp.]
MRRNVLAFLTTVAVTSAAASDPLPLKGSYGNKDGCAYAKTGESTGSDDFFLLTPETVTTAASYCEFQKVLKSAKGAFHATITCQEEGADAGAPFEIDVTPSGMDGYTLKLDDGTVWGPLKLCE